MPSRDDRISGESQRDNRSRFQQDRDRIQYSDEFRRLAGVTQVVSPGEGEIFHNRLTHSLKVAQVARRLAEAFLTREGGRELADAWGGIDPDAVEAAALGHDLGHPPFGHTAEEVLNRRVSEALQQKLPGYEGNAQSFRIVTGLVVRRKGSPHGLDLCRATLNALIKYPTAWTPGAKKYNAYFTEANAFAFARSLQSIGREGERCIEAQIMDWADDITYSVHDTEDFYRAGLIPLDRLAVNEDERESFLIRAADRRGEKKYPIPNPYEVRKVFYKWCASLLTKEPYSGTRDQRAALRETSSALITQAVAESRLIDFGKGGDGIAVPPDLRTRVELMKELTWVYVSENPALATHREGEAAVINGLFDIYLHNAGKRKATVFPARFRDDARELFAESPGENDPRVVRLVADTIAAMTDGQARQMYQRFRGLSPASALDLILT